MSDVWVVNASPLILLGKIGQINLLPQLSRRLVVPEAVALELRAGPPSDPARLWVEGEGLPTVMPAANLDPLVTAWDLGPGESHVLTLCRNLPDAEAILDDRAARNCAAALNIRVRGTIAVIVMAKRRGIVPRAKPLLEAVLAQGLRLDPALVQKALSLAGE